MLIPSFCWWNEWYYALSCMEIKIYPFNDFSFKLLFSTSFEFFVFKMIILFLNVAIIVLCVNLYLCIRTHRSPLMSSHTWILFFDILIAHYQLIFKGFNCLNTVFCIFVKLAFSCVFFILGLTHAIYRPHWLPVN